MKNCIAQFRKQKGLSQIELAKAAHITRQYLSEIERGIKTPGADIARRICQQIGAPFEEVFSDPSVHYREQAAASESRIAG